jgi:Fur family transcriptional regulator, zinc uptake regulator
MSKAKTSRESSIRRRPVFPAPDHDHDRCSSDAMAVAEMLCAQRGQRLTPIRRKVLAALLDTHKPLGAYEIIERLALKGPRPAPITAYRDGSFVVFLICERCGAVGEASSDEVTTTLTSAARAAGFTPKSPVIELSGICTHCRET